MTDPIQLVQGTEEWRLARCGSLGASDLHKVMARTKAGWGATREDIKAQLVCELLTGTSGGYQSLDMLAGQEREPLARDAYAFLYNVDVEQTGIWPHPRIKGTHASPDGLIGTDGLIEIKCPKESTHLATLCGGSIDKKYLLQCHWQLACTGRQWVDWCSFHPAFPPEMQLFVERIRRDDKQIAELEHLVQDFLSELAQTLAGLRNRYLKAAA